MGMPVSQGRLVTEPGVDSSRIERRAFGRHLGPLHREMACSASGRDTCDDEPPWISVRVGTRDSGVASLHVDTADTADTADGLRFDPVPSAVQAEPPA